MTDTTATQSLPLQNQITLHPRQPYDFPGLLRDLEQYPLDVTERVSNDYLIRGVYTSHDGPMILGIRAEGSDLQVRVYAASSIPGDIVKEMVTRILNLDLDLQVWYNTLDESDPLGPILSPLWGLKPGAKPTIFESMITAILEQQLNVKFACTLETRFIQMYGEQIDCDLGHVWLFPRPKMIAALEYDNLRPLQISSAKSRYIIDIARDIATGSLAPESWRQLPENELITRLTAIRGIGRWSAEYICMIGYGRFGHAPAADIGLRNAITQLENSGKQISEDQARAYMSQWGEMKGLATIYIWHAYSAGLLDERTK